MLAKPHRITRGADYRATVRRGARFTGANTVAYVRLNRDSDVVRFGFIVSKQVGNAVTRNTIRRRLKDVCARQLPLPDGVDVVIRALPSAADAPFTELLADVDRAVARGVR